MIAFWTGAGGWIVVMYGALNNIGQEVMEAARVDGAGADQNGVVHPDPASAQVDLLHGHHLASPAGTQLFVEPRVLSQASKGVVPGDYSLNQLAYLYAFDRTTSTARQRYRSCCSWSPSGWPSFFVFRGGLFERD